MEGPVQEGTYRDPGRGGEFVRVEIRKYPRERFVVLELEMTDKGHRRKNTDTPALTDEEWSRFESWL